LRLQQRIAIALGVQLPLDLISEIESELIAVRQEALIEGKRAGYASGRAATRELGPRDLPTTVPAPRPRSYTPQSYPPPPPLDRDRDHLDSRDVTPVHPVDWTGPRRDR